MKRRESRHRQLSDRAAQEARIQALRTKLEEDHGALLGPGPDPHDPRKLDLEEDFLRRVLAFETAASATTTLAKQLIEDGIELPPPSSLTGESLTTKLWEVIQGLARRRSFLSSTDHLSEAELYAHLWEQVLNEPDESPVSLTGEQWTCHIDLVSDGSEESCQIWLRHYAIEEERDLWAVDFPDDPIPEHLDPPYDRDRHLPQPFAEPGEGGDHSLF